jgi:hypothetical protein
MTEEDIAKYIAGLFTEIAAIREVMVQSLAMQARQAADDPEAYCRKLSERVRPETDTDIQAAVLERIDGIIAQISRVSKIG